MIECLILILNAYYFFLESFLRGGFEDKGAPLHVDQPIQMKDINFICFLFNFIMN